VIEARRGVISFDGEMGVAERFGYLFRPTNRRGEEFRAENAFRIAKTGDMDDQ
jgi:hypothetical protein